MFKYKVKWCFCIKILRLWFWKYLWGVNYMNINAEFYKGKDLFENGKYEDALGTLLQCYE